MPESPLFVKLHDLIEWILNVTAGFPRTLRFNLAEYLQRYALDLNEQLVRATQAEASAEGLHHLNEAGILLALLRSALRISERKGCITPRQLEHTSEQLRELSNLLRAWQRKLQTVALQTVNGPTAG